MTSLLNREEHIKEYNKNKLEYNKEWNERNKEKVRERAKMNYIKKITDNPEYREILKQKTKERQQKQREGIQTNPIGRPRKHPIREKKPNGRPRKYNILNDNINE